MIDLERIESNCCRALRICLLPLAVGATALAQPAQAEGQMSCRAVDGGSAVHGRITSASRADSVLRRLVLHQERQPPIECIVEVRTDGTFELPGIEPGLYSLRVADTAPARQLGAIFTAVRGASVEVAVRSDRPNRLIDCLEAEGCAAVLARPADTDPLPRPAEGLELLALRLAVALARLQPEPAEILCFEGGSEAMAFLRQIDGAVVARAECDPPRVVQLGNSLEPLRHARTGVRAAEISTAIVGVSGVDATVNVTVLTRLSGGGMYSCELRLDGNAWTPRTCWRSFDL